HGVGGGLDLLVAVRVADRLQRAHPRLQFDDVDAAFGQPRVSGHVRFRHDVARVHQVHAVPVVGVAAADAGQVRTGALAAPLVRAVVDRFAGQRIVAVAFGLEAQ